MQVTHALKNLLKSVHRDAPMRVISLGAFRRLGKLPRSDDRLTVHVSEIPWDSKLIFISHRWLRPWHTQKECEHHGHAWAGMAHPDDAACSKHRLICAGLDKLAAKKEWDAEKVFLWLDFCGVEQDDGNLLKAGVASLRGYVSACDAVLIPSAEVPAEGERTVDQIKGEYGRRAWTRLESMSFYTVYTRLVCAWH